MKKTTEKMKMRLGVRVLFLKYCSQFSLSHSRNSRIFRSSLSFNRFLSFVGICTIFISLRDCLWTSVIANIASWCPGLFHCTTWIHQIIVSASLFSRRFVRDINLYDVVEISYKRIVPTNVFLFSIFQIVFPSIPNIRKGSVFLVAARSASFAL